MVRVEVVRRHSSSFIFSFRVWLKMQPLYVWVFFYDAQVCTTLFSQMTNYEYAYVGTVYEFILATGESLYSEANLHECPIFQIMCVCVCVCARTHVCSYAILLQGWLHVSNPTIKKVIYTTATNLPQVIPS